MNAMNFLCSACLKVLSNVVFVGCFLLKKTFGLVFLSFLQFLDEAGPGEAYLEMSMTE